jgi:hypothetical protein
LKKAEVKENFALTGYPGEKSWKRNKLKKRNIQKQEYQQMKQNVTSSVKS